MKFKLIISFFVGLCLINLSAFSQNAQSLILKRDGNIAAYQEKLITNAFIYINKAWEGKGSTFSRNETKKYFDPKITLIINGKKIFTGYSQFDAHFRQVSKMIRGKIRFPLLEFLSVGNKVIVHFNEDIHDNNGTYYPANVIAIFTLHNGKIQQWNEVAHSKFFCQAESGKVVFSHE